MKLYDRGGKKWPSNPRGNFSQVKQGFSKSTKHRTQTIQKESINYAHAHSIFTYNNPNMEGTTVFGREQGWEKCVMYTANGIIFSFHKEAILTPYNMDGL